jgi:hypothetical protein
MVLYMAVLYSMKGRISVKINIAFISWLVVEVYQFEHYRGTSQNINFDKICVNYVKYNIFK